MFYRSFYATKIPKAKKAAWLDCLFALLESASIKDARKMLVKLTPVLCLFLSLCFTILSSNIIMHLFSSVIINLLDSKLSHPNYGCVECNAKDKEIWVQLEFWVKFQPHFCLIHLLTCFSFFVFILFYLCLSFCFSGNLNPEFSCVPSFELPLHKFNHNLWRHKLLAKSLF